MFSVRKIGRTLALGALALLAVCADLRAQALEAAEYFWDNDPGTGNGSAIAIQRGETLITSLAIDVSALSVGSHQFGVRTKDEDQIWSAVRWLPIRVNDNESLLADPGAPADERPNLLVGGEYFWDTDPGFGNGIPISGSAGATFTGALNVDVTALAVGLHQLGVRTKNALNEWSSIRWLPIRVHDAGTLLADPGAPADERPNLLVGGEYFWDADPGVGNGIPVPGSAGATFTGSLNVDVTALAVGPHQLGVRTKNALNEWSAIRWLPIRVHDAGTLLADPGAPVDERPNHLVGGEYFWDTDPGIGNGIPVSVPAGATFTGTLNVDVTGLAVGPHQLGVRTKNALNEWSAIRWLPIRVHDADTLLADPGAPVDERPNHLVGGEYFWDTDPGVGSGIPVSVPAGATFTGALNVDVTALTVGLHQLGVRTKNALNEWSAIRWLPIRVHDTDTLLADPGAPVDERPNHLVGGEYFWDTDPGVGNGIAVPGSAGATFTGALNVDVTTLAVGIHRLGVRTKNALNEWSAVRWLPIRVNDSETLANDPYAPHDERPRMLVGAEYFWNTDPGPGLGTSINLPPGATMVGGNPSLNDVNVAFPDTMVGVNLLGVRVREASGAWSPIHWATLEIPGTPVAKLNGVEYPSGVVQAAPGTVFTVEMSTRYVGGTIYYTTNGADPLSVGEIYNGPFTMTAPFSLRMIALSIDFEASPEAAPINTIYASTAGGGTVEVLVDIHPQTGAVTTRLRATPATASWALQGWTGDASGNSPEVTIQMDRPRTASAIFTTTLNTSATGFGAIDRFPNQPRYAYGTEVRLSAIPDAGNFFRQWGGAVAGQTASPITYTVTAGNATLSALFAALPPGSHALTTLIVGGGTVTKAPQQQNYAANSVVQLTATPRAGWTFLGWSGDASGNANPLPVTMTGSKTVSATFIASADAASIATEPLDLELFSGEPARFTVEAAGAAPLSYQWYFGETLLEGQVSSRLEFAAVAPENDGEYSVVVTNPYGSATSRRARLRVNLRPNDPPLISLRSPLATDSFRAPVDLALVAEATDSDGAIGRVEFYGNGALLGTVTTANPAGVYTHVWANAPAGVNTIFARAFDDDGAAASTLPRDITVQPPQVTAFSFAQASYSFNENAGVVQIVVTKSGTTAASVSFTTRAVTAEVGRDFAEASGTLQFSPEETSKNIAVQLLNEYVADGPKQFEVVLSSPNNGTILGSPSVTLVTTQDDDVAGASLLEFRPSASRPLPIERGSIQITLTPAGQGGWKFRWERTWRASDAIASDLDPGEYPIEFRAALGYQSPATQTITLASGQARQATFNYQAVANQVGGTLGVMFEPLGGGAVPRWRLVGDVAWRIGGDVIQNLPPGSQVVEFEPVSGFVTPAPRQALIQAGISTTLSVTYSQAPPAPAGVTLPSALTYRAIRDAQFAIPRQPFPMVGQLRTPAGYGSGIAVRDRVVLTAAHVLFDEGRLNYFDPAEIEWFQERNAGEYEPRPLRPLGFYVPLNYLVERTLEREGGMPPGVSGPNSQRWDVAAVYFSEPVARAGQSGYLVSDLPANQWLMSGASKALAGYPLVGAATDGRMNEVRGGNYTFTAGGDALFLTPDFLSYPGNSGGPVMVAVQDGAAINYFPAGVYLGSRSFDGRMNSVVRAIDSSVATLIARAQSSAELGVNFLGGGFSNVGTGGGGLTAGFLTVNLLPAGAVTAGAGWGLQAGGPYNPSGSQQTLVAGTYTLNFAPVAGYTSPAPRVITLQAGAELQLTETYTGAGPARPTISGLTLTADRKIRFNIGAAPGQRVVIEMTRNFVNWDPVDTRAAPFIFESPATETDAGQYFRARLE